MPGSHAPPWASHGAIAWIISECSTSFLTSFVLLFSHLTQSLSVWLTVKIKGWEDNGTLHSNQVIKKYLDHRYMHTGKCFYMNNHVIFFHVWKHWSKMLLSYDTTRTFNLCVCMIYYLLLLYFCVPLKSILPQLRYSKQSFLHSITCCYASLQIWTAQWPVCVYLPVSAQKVCGNSSNADKFFILAETFLTFTLYGQSLMCSSLN